MKWVLTLCTVILFCTASLAEINQYEYHIKISLSTKDGRQNITLLDKGSFNEPVEGYFSQTEYEKILQGNIIKGGFNFLDPDVFGGIIESDFVRGAWVKNNFPVKDLEVLTNSLDIGKALSFYIYPQIKSADDDSISFFFKYAVFNLLRHQPDYNLDYDYNLKLKYKLFTIPFDKKIVLASGKDLFDNTTLEITCRKVKVNETIINLPSDEVIQKEIVKSAEQSAINDQLKFSIEFIQENPVKKDKTSFNDFISRVQQRYPIPGDLLYDGKSQQKYPVPVYQSILNFPFHIFNTKKDNLYKEYKTRDKIFQSNYNIILVPIKYEDESLIADLFITYSKLQIDEIPRWTPIKKRIKIDKTNGIKIDFPKENWSAVFTREGEKYEIYGSPDFEQYVDESLVITFLKGE